MKMDIQINNHIEEMDASEKMLAAVIIVAAALMYVKTADVFSYFAPDVLNQILGIDVSIVYGLTTALLVEGLALILHFSRRAHLSRSATTVKWIALIISGLCQVFDGFLSTGNAANMSDTMKFGLQYMVPVIPLLIVVMIVSIGTLPKDNAPRAEFKGIMNYLPSMDHILYGKGGKGKQASNTNTVIPPQNEMARQLKELGFSDNGQEESKPSADFTKGRGSR